MRTTIKKILPEVRSSFFLILDEVLMKVRRSLSANIRLKLNALYGFLKRTPLRKGNGVPFLLAVVIGSPFTIADYNRALPYWGTTWSPGTTAVNGYHPNFYTGFAMRSEFPQRIHIRLARGNQTRVSVILDEQTISDYLFDLAKRYEFYKVVSAANGLVRIPADNVAKTLPQLQYFNQIIESSKYGILSFVAQGQAHSPEDIYAKGLQTLTTLNSGRVFNLHIDLRSEFLKWKSQIQSSLSDQSDVKNQILAINSLLWGRINYTQRPSAEVLEKLKTATSLALSSQDESPFILAALDLFKAVTGTKYQIKVLGTAGHFENAIDCENARRCFLNYPEFTAIYPTGSVMESTHDEKGNQINNFATPGLWQFLQGGSRSSVDNIRDEPYYGWAPKMDYEAVGNGFHNPAVRFYGINSAIRNALGVTQNHNTLWTVKRGGVSHGCSRLPIGHIWEMRHIMPVESLRMTEVYYFGNQPQDFDVYDIDGDGQPEVMGVEYLIQYGLQGTGDIGRREGTSLEISNDKKLGFYTNLYGANGVFTVNSQGQYIFTDPSVSVHSYLDFHKKGVAVRPTMTGAFRLYEQPYERDKVQLYSSPLTVNSPSYKDAVRLMGRVRGCAPTSDKVQCGEAAFDHEAQGILSGPR